jgi:hypothetical protein
MDTKQNHTGLRFLSIPQSDFGGNLGLDSENSHAFGHHSLRGV